MNVRRVKKIRVTKLFMQTISKYNAFTFFVKNHSNGMIPGLAPVIIDNFNMFYDFNMLFKRCDGQIKFF